MTAQSSPPPSPRLALITCLFDLARREENAARRPPSFYLEAGEFLFGLNQDIVFFVDGEFEKEVIERRHAHGLSARTAVVPSALEAMPAIGLVERIGEARSLNPVRNANPTKDTPNYVALMWSKFDMLREALTADPFGSTHFAWIDFGIAHVARVRHCLADGIFDRPADPVKLLMLQSPAPDAFDDRKQYFAYHRGLVAGGYFSGSKSSMATLCERFQEEARAALAQGFGPYDEQLLPVIAAAYPQFFEFYYGDYDHILENYVRLRGSPENLLFQMRVCRERGDFRRGCDIGARMLASHRQGTFEAEPGVLSALLDEYFIAAYYLEHPSQVTARDIAEYYVMLTRMDPAFNGAFLRDREHVRANFAFLREPVLP